MVDAYRLRSPLDHLGLAAQATETEQPGVTLSEVPYRGIILIRGDAEDAKFTSAVKKAVRLDVPVEPNTIAGRPSGNRIFWLGPDEWAVITKPGGGDRPLKALWKALKEGDLHASVVDSSEARTSIVVSGPNARDVIAKGCSLDLHASVFAPGQCAQTVVSKVGVIMTQTAGTKDGSATYELYPLRSFATYLWTWLADASQEYGLKVD